MEELTKMSGMFRQKIDSRSINIQQSNSTNNNSDPINVNLNGCIVKAEIKETDKTIFDFNNKETSDEPFEWKNNININIVTKRELTNVVNDEQNIENSISNTDNSIKSYETDNELLNSLQDKFPKLDLNLLSKHIDVANVTEEIIDKLKLDVENNDTDYTVIAHRLFIMQAMLALNSEDTSASYDHDSPVLSMDTDHWHPVSCVEIEKPNGKSINPSKDESNIQNSGFAFKLTNNQLKVAIDAIFTDKNYLCNIDCSTGMQLAHLKALLDLGVEESKLLQACNYHFYIMPDGYMTKEGYARSALFESKILINDKIDDEEKLVPGDSVYFMNYSDYSQKNTDGTGAWQGEHAIYFGPNSYSGFGTEINTKEKLIDTLETEYKKVAGIGKKKEVQKEESNQVYADKTFDRVLPGLCKEICSISPGRLRDFLY